jgi:hypothetical protein
MPIWTIADRCLPKVEISVGYSTSPGSEIVEILILLFFKKRPKSIPLHGIISFLTNVTPEETEKYLMTVVNRAVLLTKKEYFFYQD